MVSARRIFSWVVASAVAAALIELVVGWLDQYMRRAVAVVLVLLLLVSSAGVLTVGVLRSLDREVDRLQHAAPQAAADIETASRFREQAQEMRLSERVRQAVDRLSSPSSGLAGDAVSSVGAYTVCGILTILFLSWGPRVLRAGADQLAPQTRRRVFDITSSAFVRSRRYVMLSIVHAVVVGLAVYAACRLADLPAASPLALAIAVTTLVPYIGIVVGSLPMLLIAAGFAPAATTTKLAVFVVVMQVISSAVLQPRIVRLSNLYVGPAVIVIGFLAGFELYGVGGAMYALALAVLGVAAIDAATEITEEPSETERALSTVSTADE